MAKTLKTIAEKLNISRRTLSRVLKNDKNVAPETRERVIKFLEKEKYYPNFHAAQLASKKKVKIIGLILPKGAFLNADYYIIEILRGVAQVAEENEFEIMLYSHEHFETLSCLKLYKSRLVGGLMLVAMGRDDFEVALELKKEKVPFILINSHYDKIDSVNCNNKLGGYLATSYLIESGRKKIAFIHGHKKWVDAIDRFEGYRKALKEAKIPFDKDYVEFGYFAFEYAEAATKRLLNLRQPPDAIFAANDNMAIGAINAIKKAKLNVPKDIAVIGFDNIPTCEHFDPPITTVNQPLRRIASLGIKRLIEIMTADKKIHSQTKFVKPKLIIRKSA
jgi:LacI family transcriptional regulator